MASSREVEACGLPWEAASLIGSDQQLVVSAAGTTQLNATVLTGEFIELATVGSGAGVQLPATASIFMMVNGGDNACKVYPPVGGYMNGVLNAAFSVTNAKTGIFLRSEGRFIGVLSA